MLHFRNKISGKCLAKQMEEELGWIYADYNPETRNVEVQISLPESAAFYTMVLTKDKKTRSWYVNDNLTYVPDCATTIDREFIKRMADFVMNDWFKAIVNC